ncbi:MAG: A/G-specific adenine glycosylase [Smithellaceae bacterium]|jgi:A/G-specific adenine glycosylase
MLKNPHETGGLPARRLLAWYKRCGRTLPWRETADPYRIWISEIMLQQTRVDTVIPYYERFLKQFPDVFALARAPLQDVLKAWENLGYYSRARHLHEAAKIITGRFGGRIPNTLEAIRTLPGIGDYTAGAILSIAFERAVPAVDGNVRRILSRVFAVAKPINDPGEHRHFFELAASLVPKKRASGFNQALMDLGATVCRAKNPDCGACPLASLCLAHHRHLQDRLPVMRKAPAIPRRQSVAAVLRNDKGRLLVVQRPAEGLLASFWKLPGGFLKDHENPEAGLRRLVREELGLSIRVGKKIASVDHAYTHFRVTLHVYEGFLFNGKPAAKRCPNRQWAAAADLKKRPLSKIDRMAAKLI